MSSPEHRPSGTRNTSVRVSYVVATRNRASVLRGALEAWRALKGANDELIVVDGGSTDGSVAVLTAATPDPVDCLISEPDRSEAHAFNKGMLAARGELIKILTDDDVFFPAALEQAYATMLAREEIDVLNTGGEICDFDGRVVAYQAARPTGNPFWRLGCGVGLILRRKSLAVTGLMDVRHRWADTSFLVQVIQRGANFRFLQLKTFRYLPHRSSTSQSNLSRQRREMAQILRDQGVHWRYRLSPVKDAVRGLREPWLLPIRLFGALRAPGASGGTLCEPHWDGKVY